MINKSIWLKDIKISDIISLNHNIETDVLIIGGGITGITTAYFLMNKNLNITVVDQNKIAYGHTSKTTGKLTYLQGTIYNNIESIYNRSTSLKYLESQKEAINIVKNIIIENNIKCNFESNNSYIFTNKNSNISKLKKVKRILKGSNIKQYNNIPIKFPCCYALKVNDTAVFHPVKYVLELKRICKENKIEIYENTRITNIDKNNNIYVASGNNFKISAKKIVFACHYPFFINPYFFPFKTSIEKGYLCAGICEKNKRFNAINEDNEIHSIRYHSDSKEYIIYCSEERNLGANINNQKNHDNLLWKAKTNLTNNIKYSWFNTDIMTIDYLPIIGKLNKNNDNLLIGTGYNTWGMTNGTIAGKVISDIILKNNNKYISLFNPNRKFNTNKLPNYISYNLKSGYHYVLSKIKNKYVFYENVKIIEKNKITYGVYTDKNKKEHIVYNKCPHLKCNLIFNEIDKTWDCPCHASRFSIDGRIISGPSIYSISVEKKKK